MLVDLQRAADYGAIAGVTQLPHAIADHDNGRATGSGVFGLQKSPAENRTHAQKIEIVRGDQAAPGALGVGFAGQIHRLDGETGESGKTFAALAQVPKIRIGKWHGRARISAGGESENVASVGR